MNILNITEENRFGGPHKRIGDVAEILKKEDVKTLVVFPSTESTPYQEFLKSKKVSFHTIRLHRIAKGIKGFFYYLIGFIPEVLSIRNLIKAKNIDIVHTNGAIQFKSVIAAKLAGVRSIWHLNDTYMPGFLHVLFNGVARFFSDDFIVACDRTKEYYLKHNAAIKNKTFTTIQAPVNTDLWSPEREVDRSVIKDYEGINITMVGNLNYLKGHKTFIRAAAACREIVPTDIKLNFFIVGRLLENQTDYIAGVKKLIDELGLKNVHLLGASSNVRGILKDTDIYICSSEFEASPIAVWEALSMAKAVISTDVGDVVKIFDTDNCGIHVPVGDHQAIAENIKKLIDNDVIKNEIEHNARQTAVNRFDIHKCASLHKKAYLQLLEK